MHDQGEKLSIKKKERKKKRGKNQHLHIGTITMINFERTMKRYGKVRIMFVDYVWFMSSELLFWMKFMVHLIDIK